MSEKILQEFRAQKRWDKIVKMAKGFTTSVSSDQSPTLTALSWEVLGEMYLCEGKNQEAKKYLLKAQKLSPNKETIVSLLGQVEFAEKKIDEAIALLSQLKGDTTGLNEYEVSIVVIGLIIRGRCDDEHAQETSRTIVRRAIHSYEKALQVAKSLGDLTQTHNDQLIAECTFTYQRLPQLYLNQRQFIGALTAFRQALTTSLLKDQNIRLSLTKTLAELWLRVCSQSLFEPFYNDHPNSAVYVPNETDSEVLLLLQLVERGTDNHEKIEKSATPTLTSPSSSTSTTSTTQQTGTTSTTTTTTSTTPQAINQSNNQTPSSSSSPQQPSLLQPNSNNNNTYGNASAGASSPVASVSSIPANGSFNNLTTLGNNNNNNNSGHPSVLDQVNSNQMSLSTIKCVYDSLTVACCFTGHYEFLAQAYERASVNDFGNRSRLRQFGMTLLSAGKPKLALQIFRQCMSLGYDPLATIMAAKICLNSPTKTEESIQLCQQIILHGGTHMTKAYHIEGVAYMKLAADNSDHSQQMEFYKQALASLGKAFEVDEFNPLLRYHLALHYALLRDIENAFSFIRSSIFYDSSNPDSWNLFALILSAKHDYIAALRVIDAGLKQHPSHIELLLTRAKLIERVEDSTKTMEIYTSIISILTSQGQASENDKQQNQDQGIPSSFQKIQARKAVVWLKIAELFRKWDQLDDAKLAINEAQHLQFYPPEFYYQCGMLMKASGKLKDAATEFKKSLASEPNYVPSLIEMSLIDIDEISDKVQPHSQTHPTTTTTTSTTIKHTNISNFQNKLCRANQTYLQTAVRIDPASHEAWYQLGLAYQAEGKHTEATDAFLCAVELEETAPVRPFTSLELKFELN